MVLYFTTLHSVSPNNSGVQVKAYIVNHGHKLVASKPNYVSKENTQCTKISESFFTLAQWDGTYLHSIYDCNIIHLESILMKPIKSDICESYFQLRTKQLTICKH
jgi:hypothetical protein